jgi:hypothetical protein
MDTILFQLSNIRVPLYIDVSKPPGLWALPEDYGPNQIDALLAINFIHYSSETAIDGLFKVKIGIY